MIIVLLVVLRPLFHGDDQLYAYAIGVLDRRRSSSSLMALPVLRRFGFRLEFELDWRDPRVRQVFVLMLPVTIGLGVINFDLLINSALGSLVSDQAPRAIDAAFRIYMLPAGHVQRRRGDRAVPDAQPLRRPRATSTACAATMGIGMRQICLLLVPSAAFTLVLATPITRLIYQRGAFGAHVDRARLERAVLVLVQPAVRGHEPAADAHVLLASSGRGCRPSLAVANLVVNLVVSLALYKPLGIAGLVIGTAVVERRR